MIRIAAVVFAVALTFGIAAAGEEAVPAETATHAVEASADTVLVALRAGVDRIAAASCVMCHGATRPAAGLALTAELMEEATVSVASTQIETLNLVEPGVPDRSYLIMKVRGGEGIKRSRMPLRAEPLDDEADKMLAAWIFALGPPVPADPVEPPAAGAATKPPRKKVATMAEDIVPPQPKAPEPPEPESESGE